MEKGGLMANTHSHLTLSDRIYIEQALERRMKFKDIAVFIRKDSTTILKEIRRHRGAKESGRKTALCENRSACTKQHMCHGMVTNIFLLTYNFLLLSVFFYPSYSKINQLPLLHQCDRTVSKIG